MAKEEKNTEQLYRGYCDPKCIYFVEEESLSYTSHTGKTKVKMCAFGGIKRSFGCMSNCLNGKPKYEEDNDGNTVA